MTAHFDSIKSKSEMYRRLSAGELGNTIPQYFSLEEWYKSGAADKHEYWGVRTLVPGGPCAMYCHRESVPHYVKQWKDEYGINISLMVDKIFRVTLWGELVETETGIYLYCIEHPPKGGSWRELMPHCGVSYRGVMAYWIVKRHMNANSLEDMRQVLTRFRGHVYEFSCLEECYGTCPHRNTIVWEVRDY